MPAVLQAVATPNNQYLVYDRLAGNFIGTFEGEALRAALFFTYHDGEVERAAVVNPGGTVRRLLRDNCTDDDGTHEGAVFEAAVDLGEQEASTGKFELEMEHDWGAWAAFFEPDGVGEERGPFQEAPDPELWNAFGKQPYDLTNVNDDQTEKGRQDYATLWREGDENDTPPGGVHVSASTGHLFNGRQSTVQKCRLSAPARSVRFRLETLRGWVRLKGVALRVPLKRWGRGRKS